MVASYPKWNLHSGIKRSKRSLTWEITWDTQVILPSYACHFLRPNKGFHGREVTDIMPIHCHCTLAHLNWHPTSLEECSKKMVLPRPKKNRKPLNWICGEEGGHLKCQKWALYSKMKYNCSIKVPSCSRLY